MMPLSLAMVALVADSRADSRDSCNAPSDMAARMPMIVIVTSNSTIVKAEATAEGGRPKGEGGRRTADGGPRISDRRALPPAP